MKRKAGILLHISSLPGKYGIGTLGEAAYKFVDFLEEAGQKYWQVLPIGPTSYGDSPYQSASVYAFNPYFIDFDLLQQEGLLDKADYENVCFGTNELDVDYALLFETKTKVLKKAYKNKEKISKEFKAFCQENKSWLDDYSLFMAIKESFGSVAWNEWPNEYRLKDAKTLAIFKEKNAEDIDVCKFIQFLFYRQWMALKKYANDKKIKIIGDMPIYVAYDSSDVWGEPELFYLDSNLDPIDVSGCPPDGFSEDGQLWGNPLYNWEYMKNHGYEWWVKRIKAALTLFDVVRIDHFRGFAGYFAIKFGEKTARHGEWRKGPGYDLFSVINERLPGSEIIAENLGFLDDDVRKLLSQCGYPGMCIAEFEFGDANYSSMRDGFEQNNVIYTGTHDNQTVMSFYNEQPEDYKRFINDICNIKPTDLPNLRIIEKCMYSIPDTCIIPLQDYLGLTDDDGRMNVPSTLGENWRYRCKMEDFDKKLSSYIFHLTVKSSRYND